METALSYIELIFYYFNACWPIFGLIAFGYIFFSKKHNDKMKLDFNIIAMFVGGMILMTMARLGIQDLMLSLGKELLPREFPKGVGMGGFLFVWIEDAYFCLIPWLLSDMTKNKRVKFLLWCLFSVQFAMGHIYLGVTWAVITLIYPYFISYRYSKRHGIITVMACHFLYDCFTYLTVKLAPIILG